MFAEFRTALVMLLVMTILTGVLYPLAITGVSQVIFPNQANGSRIVQDGQSRGSSLIGQPFDDPKYFWGRLSGTSPFPYNAGASSGSNLGPSNDALIDAVKARIDALKQADPENMAPIPVDLVTASGSGLDPHISIDAALYQLPRIARARGLNPAQVRALVDQFTAERFLGIFGEPRVNVLKLNLALDVVK